MLLLCTIFTPFLSCCRFYKDDQSQADLFSYNT